MSIQYSGTTLINNTYTSDGTRSGLQTWLVTQLVAAGWTVAAGSGSDVTLKAGPTPQGASVLFRFFDPGSGNCVQITMKNNGVPTSLTSSTGFMLPTNTLVYRIVANAYQFFAFASGSANRSTARYVIGGGVPYLPSFMVTNLGSDLQIGWFHYTGASDTDSLTTRVSFRSTTSSGTGAPIGSSLAVSNMVNYTLTTGAIPLLPIPQAIINSISQFPAWKDGSAYELEPFIGWSSTSAANGPFVMWGQLWDAVTFGVQLSGETTYALSDGHTYMAITDTSNTIFTLAVAVS